MPIVTTRCVVLQTFRYSDTSKILRLMTREHGPRSAIARGALRPRSRLAGLLEPFAEGRATLYLKSNRDLHTLSDFELLHARQELGSDLDRFSGASVLCELVLRLAPEQADQRLYEALTGGLDALLAASVPVVPSVALGRIWRLVAVLGFAPALDLCLECGRPIASGEPGRFDCASGGVRCESCSQVGALLSGAELTKLRALAGGGDGAGDVTDRQVTLVADFIRHHLAEGVRLRSLDFLGLGRVR
ncbi:MAG: DNA repair protein RecO [Gemmatimonadota bacterium]